MIVAFPPSTGAGGGIQGSDVPTYEINYTEVATYADLPAASTQPNETYIVRQASGTWLLGTKKKAGLYYSNGVDWAYMGNSVSIDDSLVSNESVWSSDKTNATIGGIIDDTVPAITKAYSSSKTQELHNAQAIAIANLSGASASFYNNSTQLIPETPTAFLDLTWTNGQASSNATIFELGANEINFYRDGHFSFLNTLTFLRVDAGATATVTFEIYDADTSTVIGTFTQPIDMQQDTKETVPMNAVLIISGATDAVPVRVKVRMQSTLTSGTIELFSFSSILVAQSVVNVADLETDPVFLASPAAGITTNQVNNMALINAAQTFTTAQRTSISTEDNAIDFTTNNNFTLTATAANITVTSLVGCVGQSGVIVINSANNITGWGAEFVFKTVPTGLTGTEVFAYFVESLSTIHIGKVA